MALKVGIIGAGIAGLSSAIALQRAGHSVEVFEQSQFKSEVGAAITVTPNGALVLKEWGFDFDKAGAVEAKQVCDNTNSFSNL
jgi:salicylate hydroxylase